MPSNARQKILDVASDLVLQKGFPATTVDEICVAAGASKGSFYHFFKTKEKMGLALLAESYETDQKRLFAAPWATEEDAQKRLVAFLAHVEESAEPFWGDGSLMGGFAIDVAATNPVMQERISTIIGSLTQRLAPVFEPAAGPTSPTAVELAEHWISVIEGAIVLSKGHQDPTYIANGLTIFRDHIERLLEANSKP